MSLKEKQTYFFKKEEIDKKWYLVDATNKTLGRLASQIASVLRGKHKPLFTPNSDVGDFVVVVNADRVKLTGKRLQLKKYFHYTGYPGGARFENLKDLLKTKPEKVLLHAVKGMIPHNRLGKKVIQKLKIYSGPNHPHTAQKPEILDLK